MWPPYQKKVNECIEIKPNFIAINKTCALLHFNEDKRKILEALTGKKQGVAKLVGHVSMIATTFKPSLQFKPKEANVPTSDFLYDHQKLAVRYALGNKEEGLKGAMLALDQGLGKTIIGLETFIRGEFERLVIIAPKSLIKHWQQEAKEFYGMEIIIPKNPDEFYESPRIVTNYEQLKVMQLDRILLNNTLLILDEATKVKNSASGNYKALEKIRGQAFVLGLSGTPIENNIEEFFNILNLVYGGFMYRRVFEQLFVRRETIWVKGEERKVKAGYKNLKLFKQIVKPFFLRKRKDEVLMLPERNIKTIVVPLTETQNKIIELLQELANEKYKKDVGAAKLATLVLIRRVENDPRLILKGEHQFRKIFLKIDELHPGPKLFALPQIIKEHGKIVIFSEFEDMIDLIEEYLRSEKYEHVFKISGKLSAKKRHEIINKFKKAPEPAILLGTDAIAHGVNLQFANAVVNFDLPWNPAIRHQRIDRIYRIGTTNEKHVYDLISDGLEKRVYDIITQKSVQSLYILEDGNVKRKLSKVLDEAFVNYWWEIQTQRMAKKQRQKAFEKPLFERGV